MFFPRLESRVDLSVFGRVLAQPCTTKAKEKPRGTQSLPVMAVSAQPADTTDGNLTLHNNTGRDLQALLRGPEDRELRLKPGEQQSVSLKAGEYVAGLFAPGECRMYPLHETWQVDDFVRTAMELRMQTP